MRRLLLLAIGVLALAILPTGGALALPAMQHAQGGFTLTALALLGSDGTDVYLTFSGSSGPVPDRIDKVQLKALRFEGQHLQTSEYLHVPAPGGVAVLHLDALARHRPLHFRVHVKQGLENVVEADTRVQLRPDLTVATVSAPTDVVRRRAFALDATVTEIA